MVGCRVYCSADLFTQDTRSPPKSILKPSPAALRTMIGLLEGCTTASKFNLRLASRAVAGVLPAIGVRAHAFCAGDGVTLTKSAKLKLVPGVFGPKFIKPAPLVLGVICEDGSGVDLDGGVVGGCTIV